jgi:hypothetical protein
VRGVCRSASRVTQWIKRGAPTHLAQKAMQEATDMVGLVVLAAASARPTEPSAMQPTLFQPGGMLEPAMM